MANEEGANAPETSDSKRRRKNDAPLSMNDLPETTVAIIASFLPRLSRAWFAIATTAPCSRWRDAGGKGDLSHVGKIILPPSERQLEAIDLRDERHLRRNLTDDALGALLVVIGGAGTVQRLILSGGRYGIGCCGIAGQGLAPLRGSSALRQIDLDVPNISEDVGLPILESILGSEECSLEHVQLPTHWRKGQSSNLQSFLWKFDDMLFQRKIGCSEFSCGQRCGKTRYGLERFSFFETWGASEGSEGFGMQRLTCYKCLRNYCGCCKFYDGETHDPKHCSYCDKFLCGACAEVESCGACKASFCSFCTDYEGTDEKCSGIDCEAPVYCPGCHYSNIYECSYCKAVLCNKCAEPTFCGEGGCSDCDKVACADCCWETDAAPKRCKECKYASCKDCLWEDYQSEVEKGDWYLRQCEGCMALLFPLVEAHNAKLSKEVEELKSKLAALQGRD